MLLKCLCVASLVGLAVSAALQGRPYFDNSFCDDFVDDDRFPHYESCAMYLTCWGGEIYEMTCLEGDLFDAIRLICDEAQFVTCLEDVEQTDPTPQDPDDGFCPSNGIVFRESQNCNEYYLCVNGEALLRVCHQDLHWNIEAEICDYPQNAGCDPEAVPIQNDNCPDGFVGFQPHPTNCNRFIHCNNGNRMVQQCPHLHHFDVTQGRCIFKVDQSC